MKLKTSTELPLQGTPENGHGLLSPEKERRLKSRAKLKQYNLVLPQELYDALEAAADRQHTSVVFLIRQSIKLGLLALELESSPDGAIIARAGDVERQLVIF